MLEGPFVRGRCGIGLFVDLLAADQKRGIELIRHLVTSSEGPTKSDDGFVLTLAGCELRVSPVFSYGWSRGNAPSRIVTVALKALEYAAHKRIETGERLDDVVRQIIGDGPISGAILLVIVDLVLSHSPLAGQLLAQLVASPELLTLDTNRARHNVADKMSGGTLRPFPQGRHPSDAAVEQSLADRTSRTIALHNAISQIVLHQPDEATADLRAKLAAAVARLGAWTDAAIDWTSEQFMASHAQRLGSKANYELITQTDANGETREGWSFRWTGEQARWSQEHTSGVVAENTAFNRSLALRMAMDDDQKSVTITVADAEAVLLATADASPHDVPEHHDPNDPWLSRVASAAFLARFGSNETVAAQQATLSAIFDRALQQASGELPNLRYDVMYDAHALAIAGRLYLSSRFEQTDDRRALLNAASTNNASAAAVISRHRQAAKNIGDQPLRSAIRIGLQACEFPRQKDYDEEKAAFDARQARLSAIKSTRLAAELHWLEHGGDEPAWPSPPLRRQRRPKRSIVLPGGKPKPRRARPEPQWPDTYFDDRTAAVWLHTLALSTGTRAVVAVLNANHDWLIDANSRGDEDDDDTDLERTWTRALFECAASHAKTWTDSERNTLVYDVLDQFSDAAFIDTAAAFLVKSDLNHIEGGAADAQYLVDLRAQIWARLNTTTSWKRHCRSPRGGLEIHLNELILAFFCKVAGVFGYHTSYTKGLKDEQIIPFLPVLTEIVVASAACPSIARLFLNVLELIDPKQAEPFLFSAATSWLSRGDQRFWNELGIGQRVCGIAEKAEAYTSAQQWVEIADVIAATGVVAGETLKQALRARP